MSPADSAENRMTLWVSAVAFCTLPFYFCQVRMVCHLWRAPHPAECWLQGPSPRSKVPGTGRWSSGRGTLCSGSVEHREPCTAGRFGGVLSANTTYFPCPRNLVASWRGTSGTFPTNLLPPMLSECDPAVCIVTSSLWRFSTTGDLSPLMQFPSFLLHNIP